MSRVPIAALLRPDAVEKFVMHDRTYYKYKNDIYNFPADDTEFERLDVMHQLIYSVALNNQLHYAVFRTPPSRILDVGFGTGFWMIDMEYKYSQAEIIGIDLDDSVVKGNSKCIFKSPVDFTAPQWPVDDSSMDLVHMSQLCGCVPDWLAHYRKAFRCLRPGTGQIEHVEIDWRPRTNQANFPAAAMDMWNWWGWVCQASERSGKHIAYNEQTEEMLEQAGFVDISHKKIRIPLYCNGQKDPREWQLAHGYQTAMGHVGSQSFPGFSMALLTRYLGFTPQQVYELCERVVHVVRQKDLPLHVTLHICTARRPQT